MKALNNKGMSLIELLIAIVITGVVLSSLIFVMVYCSNSMRDTEKNVNLQTEAKNIVAHMSSVIMEGTTVSASGSSIIVENKSEDRVGTALEKVNYWQDGSSIYYASPYIDPAGLPSGTDLRQYLLGDYVEAMNCSVMTNETTGKKYVHLILNMKNDDTEFECSNDIYTRNQ